jgi:hypothetical protein
MTVVERARRHPCLALYGSAGLAVLAWIVVTALAPNDRKQTRCGGFGCDWSVQDRLFFYGWIIGVPVVAAMLVVGTAVLAIRRRRL